jgi:8-oxo-dGTP diphosphatase
VVVGRFYAGVAALVRAPDGAYLLLRRSPDKDFAPGVWECVTGRVDQGESFEQALHREVYEELRAAVQVDFMLGTTHFYRGAAEPANELLGVAYCCTLEDPSAIVVSPEHTEHCWVTAGEAAGLLAASDPSTAWIRALIERAERIRQLLSPDLVAYYRARGFELD